MRQLKNKIVTVSYPRSGVGFLTQCLRENMGESLHWCEGYEEQVDWEYHNMLKTHDFSHDFEAPDFCEVIALVRHPFASVTSWFTLQVGNYQWEDTYEQWIDWAPKAFLAWNQFVRRWCLSGRAIMVIDYLDLIANAEHYVGTIKALLSGNGALEHAPRIKPVLTDYHNFRYYRDEDFALLRSLSAFEMRLLKYE